MKAKILWLLLPLALAIVGCEPKDKVDTSGAVTNSVNNVPPATDSTVTNGASNYVPATNTPPQP